MTVLSVPDGFAIATPADWLVFDFDALQDEAQVAAFLGGRVAEVPDMEQHRDQLLALLLGAGRQAEAAGVVFGAVMVSARADGVPIVASLSIATIDRVANADALGELSPRASAEAPSQAPTNGNTDRTVGLRLPAGQAARFDRVTQVPLSAGTELLCFTVQYLLVVPGSESDLLAITFASPSMAYRERLTELFDELADTFEWTYEGS